MSALTDRMRTCAAFIIASEAHEYDNETGHVLRDAAVLLIEASDLLEAPGSAEPMEIIEPAVLGVAKLDPETMKPVSPAVWIAAGDTLPIVKHGTISPRACPKCDSRAMKTIRRREGRMMLECPACTHQWEMTTR